MTLRLLGAAAIGAALILPSGAGYAQHVSHHAVGIGIPNAKTADGQMVRRGHRGDRGLDGTALAWGYDLQSSYHDRDWAPQSGNDWWNSRPDRAYPRWVQQQHGQQACDPTRIWWSGTGWHC